MEIPRGGGQFLKECISLNWTFQRGGGFKPKKGGSVDIFWNNTLNNVGTINHDYQYTKVHVVDKGAYIIFAVIHWPRLNVIKN